MTVNTQIELDKAITQYSQAANEPAWMLNKRLAALAEVDQLDLPHVEKTKIDNWNFTSFIPFADVTGTMDEANLPPALSELIGADDENLLVQVNSRTVAQRVSNKLKEQGVIFTDLKSALQEHPELVEKYFMKAADAKENRLHAYHTAAWSGGLFLYVPKNTVIEEPILSLFAVQGEGNGLVPHILIVAEDNSRVTFVENRLSVDGATGQVHNGISEVFVGAGSTVTYAGVYSFAEGSIDYTRRAAIVNRDGHMEWAAGETGDGNAVSENVTVLAENGATVDSKLISVGTDRQRGNYTSRAVHIGKHTDSSLLSKGVLLDEAAQVFNGITKMEKGATKANGEQTERLLILSRKARGDANPILYIDEDDVKCGHAASVGRIDELQLYYLMSRGVPKHVAERMLIHGFLDPVVSEIPVERVQNRLIEAIERKLNR